MYDKSLNDAGYINFKLARTNNRGDGLLTAVHKDYFRVIDHRDFLFNDFGDRVAQLLHVKLTESFSHNNNHQQILIVNTHLLFPHDSSLSLERLRQVYKILQSVEAYQKENNLTSMPIILCGDWNGSKRGHIYKFLRSQGFVSSYDTAHHYTDADAHKWVSHINHRGNICGVDFIWLLNPNKYRKLLKASWSDAVFGLFKSQSSTLTDDDLRDARFKRNDIEKTIRAVYAQRKVCIFAYRQTGSGKTYTMMGRPEFIGAGLSNKPDLSCSRVEIQNAGIYVGNLQ